MAPLSLQRRRRPTCVWPAALAMAWAVATALPSPALEVRFLAEGDDPNAAVLERVAQGRIIEALMLPGSAAVVDPGTVRVTWLGQPIEHFVHMRVAMMALVLVPPDQLVAGEGTLRIEGTTVDGTTSAAEMHLLVDEALHAGATIAAHQRSGRSVLVADADGVPIPGAWFFGQARSDLLARTDASGRVVLDAERRNPTSHPLVWASGFEPRRVDILAGEETLTLRPARAAGAPMTVHLHPSVDDGETTPTTAVVVAEPNLFVAWRAGHPVELPTAGVESGTLLFVAPGYLPARLGPPAQRGEPIRLKPMRE